MALVVVVVLQGGRRRVDLIGLKNDGSSVY
jgi:hypothetical protein